MNKNNRDLVKPIVVMMVSLVMVLASSIVNFKLKEYQVSLEQKDKQENNEDVEITKDENFFVFSDQGDMTTTFNTDNLYSMNNNLLNENLYPAYVRFPDSFVYLTKDTSGKQLLLEPTSQRCTGYAGQVILEANDIRMANKYDTYLIAVITNENGTDGIMAVNMINYETKNIDRRYDSNVENNILSMVVHNRKIYYTVMNESNVYIVNLENDNYNKFDIQDNGLIIGIEQDTITIQYDTMIKQLDLNTGTVLKQFSILPYLTSVATQINDDIYFLEFGEESNSLKHYSGNSVDVIYEGDIIDYFIVGNEVLILDSDEFISILSKDNKEKLRNKVNRNDYGFVREFNNIYLTKHNSKPEKIK